MIFSATVNVLAYDVRPATEIIVIICLGFQVIHILFFTGRTKLNVIYLVQESMQICSEI